MTNLQIGSSSKKKTEKTPINRNLTPVEQKKLSILKDQEHFKGAVYELKVEEVNPFQQFRLLSFFHENPKYQEKDPRFFEKKVVDITGKRNTSKNVRNYLEKRFKALKRRKTSKVSGYLKTLDSTTSNPEQPSKVPPEIEEHRRKYAITYDWLNQVPSEASEGNQQ